MKAFPCWRVRKCSFWINACALHTVLCRHACLAPETTPQQNYMCYEPRTDQGGDEIIDLLTWSSRCLTGAAAFGAGADLATCSAMGRSERNLISSALWRARSCAKDWCSRRRCCPLAASGAGSSLASGTWCLAAVGALATALGPGHATHFQCS